MQPIGDYIKKDWTTIERIKAVRPLSKFQWAESFRRKLNEGRYEQDHITNKRMLRHLKYWHTNELPTLWKECDTSKNFCSHFWWRYGMIDKRVRDKIIKPKQRKLL